jgi:hypothetical protein
VTSLLFSSFWPQVRDLSSPVTCLLQFQIRAAPTPQLASLTRAAPTPPPPAAPAGLASPGARVPALAPPQPVRRASHRHPPPSYAAVVRPNGRRRCQVLAPLRVHLRYFFSLLLLCSWVLQSRDQVAKTHNPNPQICLWRCT